MKWKKVVDAKLDRIIALLNAGFRQGAIQMSALSDKLAEVQTSLTAAVSRVQEDVARLQAKIAELEALVASGGATPEDLATLDSLKATLDAIDPTKEDTLPPA